jgi:hypothetical protein
MRRVAHVLALTPLLLAGVACSASSSEQESDPPRPSVTLSTSDREKPADCSHTWVAGATGRVVDSSGNRITGATISYCVYRGETGTCLAPATSGKGGWYTLLVPPEHRCVSDLAVRVFVPKERNLRLADTYCAPALAPQQAVLEAPDHVMLQLFAPTSQPKVADPKVARDFVFRDGLTLTITPDDLVEYDSVDALSAGPVDLSLPGCAAREPLDALWAFGPEINVRILGGGKKVPFKLPAKGLADGTVVDLFLLGGTGTMIDETRSAPEAKYVKYGTGKVVAGMVVPDAGSELPALTAVGYKKRG